MAFLDWEKALDKVDQEKLIEAMERPKRSTQTDCHPENVLHKPEISSKRP